MRSPDRRRFLRDSAAAGLLLCLDDVGAQDDDPRERRAAAGDRLVRADADGAPVPLRVSDVIADAAVPIVAVPYDVAGGRVRGESKLNRVVLLRLAADASPATQGVVAFSAICTHEACAISAWNASEQRLLCPCHFSKFDVHDGGAVVEGPAPRNLPHLPLRLADGDALVVDGPFSAQPGVRRSA